MITSVIKMYRVELVGFNTIAQQWTRIVWISPGRSQKQAITVIQKSHELSHIKEPHWRTSPIGKTTVHLATVLLGKKRPDRLR